MKSKGPSTALPAATDLIKHTGQASSQKIQAYQQRVGSINFAAVITRPDVAHAVSKLSDFLTNPSDFHFECANRTLKYLGHTKRLTIQFNVSSTDHLTAVLLASSDASFADDVEARYSFQCYAFKLFNGKTSKQRTVITSSTKAELLAI